MRYTTLLLLLNISTLAIGQQGYLDTTFGTAGKVISNGFVGECFATGIQSSGKIICAGYVTPDTSSGFLLARYTGSHLFSGE